MKLARLIEVLEEIAPARFAESWDNVGLLVGDPGAEVSRALLTIDYTPEVAEEGRREGCDAVIAYHPPIFEAMKRITAGSLVFDAVRRGVAIYSLHTALDVAEGGTNDMLADVLGLEHRGPLRLPQSKPNQYKLVVFAPEESLEQVGKALFDAGAGRIGNYTACSFRTPGTGTFFGEEGSDPTVGKAGQLEKVDEVRLETVVPISRIDAVIRALREAHPYEEPAFDLVQLAAPPEPRGMGRIGSLPGLPRPMLFEGIKQALGVERLLIAGPTKGEVHRAAVCAGACGDLVNDALAQKVDLYLTGELRHHDALKAARAGMTVICALHSNSERAVLPRLATRIREKLPDLALHIAREDRDPFQVV